MHSCWLTSPSRTPGQSYEVAVTDLLRSKQAGTAPKDEAPAKTSNVVNLMDALKRSISAEKSAAEAPKAATRKKKSTAGSGATKKAPAPSKARKRG